jgi:hypothetical protein
MQRLESQYIPISIEKDYYTLDTPSQMQRECNGIAFGELTLSAILKHYHYMTQDTSKVQNQRWRRRVKLLKLSM